MFRSSLISPLGGPAPRFEQKVTKLSLIPDVREEAELSLMSLLRAQGAVSSPRGVGMRFVGGVIASLCQNSRRDTSTHVQQEGTPLPTYSRRGHLFDAGNCRRGHLFDAGNCRRNTTHVVQQEGHYPRCTAGGTLPTLYSRRDTSLCLDCRRDLFMPGLQEGPITTLYSRRDP